MSKKKLLIVMANADLEKPESCYPPLFQATVAVALSHEVEIVLTGIAGLLAVKGKAQSSIINFEEHASIHDIIKSAYSAGVTFKVCNTSLKNPGEELIDEVSEKVGAAYIIDVAMEDDTLTFTY